MECQFLNECVFEIIWPVIFKYKCFKPLNMKQMATIACWSRIQRDTSFVNQYPHIYNLHVRAFCWRESWYDVYFAHVV